MKTQHNAIDIVLADCKDVTKLTVQLLIAYSVMADALSRVGFRVFIYHKCGRSDKVQWNEPFWDLVHSVHHVELPNQGYEAHTYLEHIRRHYADLADTTLFLQGNGPRDAKSRSCSRIQVVVSRSISRSQRMSTRPI